MTAYEKRRYHALQNFPKPLDGLDKEHIAVIEEPLELSSEPEIYNDLSITVMPASFGLPW